MLNVTKTAITAILKQDNTIDDSDFKNIVNALTRPVPALQDAKPMPRVVSRQEVAKLIGRSPARVDQLVKEGKLKKVFGVGNYRAVGFTEESVRRFVEGNASGDVAEVVQ